MKVVILCGGKGTRSYPFTDYFPKVMMPISGTPIIIHLMRIFAQQGFNQFVLAAGHRKEMLEDYFEGRMLGWDVQIVDTGAVSDTGERILRCAEYVGDRFLATYGDGLGDVDLQQLIKSHEHSGGLATLTTVPLRSQYGVVQFDQGCKVTRFVEKPVVQDFWINAGFFVMEKAVFSQWHGTNLERDVLPHLADLGSLHVYRHTGFWQSMDTSKDQQELEHLCIDGAVPWGVSKEPAVRKQG